MTRIALASLALASICGLAHADTYAGGSGGNLVDATGNNTVATAGTAQFTLSASNAAAPTIAVFNSISITMGHTFAGDLVITLTSPGGQTADVLVRPGVATATGFGNGDNLGSSNSSSAPGTALYTFVNAGGTAFPTATASGGLIASGTYNRASAANATVVTGGASGNDFSVFNGTDLNGVWTLTIRDLASGDTGTVASWSLDIASRPVPAPGAAAMLGLGAIGAARRKRR
jgi:subtilisin-like proprotein convertase family protein